MSRLVVLGCCCLVSVACSDAGNDVETDARAIADAALADGPAADAVIAIVIDAALPPIDAPRSYSCNPTVPAQASCCSPAGNRLTQADCVAGVLVCPAGSLCECNGERQTYVCTDHCGSDGFVDPTCEVGGWRCGGLVPTDTCAADTCWGLPRQCCGLQGFAPVECERGEWVCPEGSDWCD